MASILFRDGAIVFDSGSIVFTDDPDTCICCGTSYSPPSSCDPCVNAGPGTTAPGAVLLQITGGTAGLNGSYVCPYFDTFTPFCRYRHTLSPTINITHSSGGTTITLTSVTVHLRASGTAQIQVIFAPTFLVGMSQGEPRGQYDGTLKDCDTHSATAMTSYVDLIDGTLGTWTVTSL